VFAFERTRHWLQTTKPQDACGFALIRFNIALHNGEVELFLMQIRVGFDYDEHFYELALSLRLRSK